MTETMLDFVRKYPHLKEHVEERAAIMQHSGEMDRETAERRAVYWVKHYYGIRFKDEAVNK